ncbi:helix-turn-helix domain-containing protein [Colwelliaceae bacterium 6471]
MSNSAYQNKKNATPRQERSILNSNSTDANTQRRQIVSLLKQLGSINTFEFRHLFGIWSPAPRILELRALGHNIETVRETYTTPDGKTHINVARYYYQGESEQILTGEAA